MTVLQDRPLAEEILFFQRSRGMAGEEKVDQYIRISLKHEEKISHNHLKINNTLNINKVETQMSLKNIGNYKEVFDFWPENMVCS